MIALGVCAYQKVNLCANPVVFENWIAWAISRRPRLGGLLNYSARAAWRKPTRGDRLG